MDRKLLVHQLTSHRQKKFLSGNLRLSSSLIDCNIGVIGVLFFVTQSYLLVQIISTSMGQSPAPRVSLDWTIRVLLQCCYLKLLLSYLSVSYVLKCSVKKYCAKVQIIKKFWELGSEDSILPHLRCQLQSKIGRYTLFSNQSLGRAT